MTANLSDAKETSMDAAALTVLTELSGIFCIQRSEKNGTEGFSQWKSFLMLSLAPI